MSSIAAIQGRSDACADHLCQAFANAYFDGAPAAGHEMTQVDVAKLNFPNLHPREDGQKGHESTQNDLMDGQNALVGADHLFLIDPLLLGTLPTLLKEFLEQVYRPGITLNYDEEFPTPSLIGKLKRFVVSMDMPTIAYRWYIVAQGLKNLEPVTSGVASIKLVRSILFELVEAISDAKRQGWMTKLNTLGRRVR